MDEGTPRVVFVDEAVDSSKAWQGLINDVQSCDNEIKLQQLITRHIREPMVEDLLRGLIRGVFFHSTKKKIYCKRCKKQHYRLALNDSIALLALNEFYFEFQTSFSGWVNRQSNRFQQGLHSATDSITMVPPIDKILKERHQGAYIEQA